MMNYFIELSVIHVLLFIAYWLFLRNDRQYAFMRFYLIGAALLALIVPLIKLPKLFIIDKAQTVAAPMEALPLDAASLGLTNVPGPTMTAQDLLLWTYIIITIFFLVKFLKSIVDVVLLYQSSNAAGPEDKNIRSVHHATGSFTFFNWIFLSDSLDKNQANYTVMLNHEKAHAFLGHTYDMLFFELFKVFCWWLPTTWFAIKEIKKIHEYQADALALQSTSLEDYSTTLINSTLQMNGMNLTSSFYNELTIKRLKAMKQKSKKIQPWKFAFLGTLSATLFLVLACSEEPESINTAPGSVSNVKEYSTSNNTYVVVESLPEFEGGGMKLFDAYVEKNATYPAQAIREGVQGHVFVQFVVEKDGTVSDVKAVRSTIKEKFPKSSDACEIEAVRVVANAPKFTAATQRGRAIRTRMILPITFKLNENDSGKGSIISEGAKVRQFELKVEFSFVDGIWTGSIHDEEGNAVPGANIIVSGSTTGTISDMEGNFQIETEENNELVISFVGYKTVRLKNE